MSKEAKKPEVKEEAKVEAKSAMPELTAEQRKYFEEQALQRVCAAGGFDLEEVIEKEEKVKNDHMVDVDLGAIECSINGNVYRGVVRVRSSTAEVLLHMAHSKRSRLLNEKLGNDYEVRTLANGGISSVLVGRTSE